MGLLSSERGNSDYLQALLIADSVAEDWNSASSKVYGIDLYVVEKCIVACCDMGADLFSSGCFPEQPGPFKRAAAFCVLGRLYPFFKMTGDQAPQTDFERHAWLARFMALSIPGVLARTKVNLNGKWIVLDDWKGFPSPHYLLEFLAWMRWLDSFERHKAKFTEADWTSFSSDRLARMVMATSLMIEACYYVNPEAPRAKSIQCKISECLSKLDDTQELDLSYAYDPARLKPRHLQ